MPWKRSDIVDAIVIAIIAILCLMWLETACRGETVVRVIDGDTVVLDDGRHVRLLGIDAPELKQPGGRESKRWLEVYVLDRPVTLERVGSAAWGRVQAAIRWRDFDIGEAMVMTGRAWVSESYLKKDPDRLTTYRERQEQAKTKRRGLWADGKPIAPWDWRDGVRVSASPAPSPPPKVVVTTPARVEYTEHPPPVQWTYPTTSGYAAGLWGLNCAGPT